MQSINVNKLPAPTWRWLKVNSENVKLPDSLAAAATREDASGVRAAVVKKDDRMPSGLGEDFSAVAATSTAPVRAYVSDAAEGKVYFRNRYESEGTLAREEVRAEKGSRLFVVMEAEGRSPLAAHDIHIQVEEDAEVTLVEVLRISAETVFLDGVYADVQDRGSFRLIQLVLGGGKVYLGEYAGLSGKESACSMDIGYLLDQSRQLDVNAVARHTGKDTHAHIAISGVVADDSRKTFRGTLDFIKGAKGAKGDVRDNVLMMSENAVNRTIPLILCGEEDVEGEHGATIGKISEETLFYFESRGIPADQVAEMMARSMVDQVISRIPDEELRTKLLEQDAE